MNFTTSYPLEASASSRSPIEGKSRFSADGSYLALVLDIKKIASVQPSSSSSRKAALSTVTLLKSESLAEHASLQCQGRCSRLLWSPGAPLLLSVTLRQPGSLDPLLELWDADQPAQFYRALEVGPGRIAHVEWAPDSRHVLVVSEYALQVSIWSFADGSVRFIEAPKWADERSLCFSHSGHALAALERRNVRDFCTIVDSEPNWRLRTRFALDGASDNGVGTDCDRVAWSADDSLLVARESRLDYGISLFEPNSGQLLATVRLPPEETAGLGVRCWCWAPSEPILATGGYDGVIRLYGCSVREGISALLVQPHASSLPLGSFVCYCERPGEAELGDEFLELPPVRPTRYELIEKTQSSSSSTTSSSSLSTLNAANSSLLCKLRVAPRPRADAAHPQCGVRWMSFSPCGRWLATICDDQPNALFVWDLLDARSNGAVLEHLRPVLSAAWCPTRHGDAVRLCAICKDSPTLYLWTPAGAAAVALPVTTSEDRLRAARGQPHFRPKSLVWSPAGNSLLLFGDSAAVSQSSVLIVDLVDEI